MLAALSRHIAHPDRGRFAPQPADIVFFLEGGTEDRALFAWSRVESAIRHVGPYQTVVFDDPAIHAAIDGMGGWMLLCNMSDDELPFRRNEFVKRYRALAERGVFEYPRRLVGIAEHHNSADGHELPEPVLIGDAELAKQVYLNGASSAGIEYRKASSLIDAAGTGLSVGSHDVRAKAALTR